MRISAILNRLLGDLGHDWYVIAVLLSMALLACWLMAEGTVDIARRTRAALRHRAAARLAVREPGRALAADDDRRIWHERAPRTRATHPVARGELGPYPEQLPPPGIADLRDTHAARRRLHAEIQAALKAHVTADG